MPHLCPSHGSFIWLPTVLLPKQCGARSEKLPPSWHAMNMTLGAGFLNIFHKVPVTRSYGSYLTIPCIG